jgi:hypothetical protein
MILETGISQRSVSADGTGLQGWAWLGAQWEVARSLANQVGACVLMLDEIQKVLECTEEVKRLWDEDTTTPRLFGAAWSKARWAWSCWRGTSRTAAAISLFTIGTMA